MKERVQNVNSIFNEWIYFAVALNLIFYMFGVWLNKKLSHPIVNPLMISVILVISFLLIFKVDYAVYQKGADYLTYFLTPATICLAVPLYKQFQVLKENLWAIMAGVIAGCLVHSFIIIGIGCFFQIDEILTKSLLPKSVTTAIAIASTAEIGGIAGVTVVGTIVAGLMGAIAGPAILKIFRINEPIAKGLGIGAASHAIGTSKMIEIGEVEAAMSSLAIVVNGILTVIIVPIIVSVLGFQ